MMSRLLLIAAVSSLVLQGCATRDPRDAAWDPKQGRALFEQIPIGRARLVESVVVT